ncbi:MAG: CysZ protein [Sphingobacteriales bacterium]|jgi:CysZ protein
MIQIGTGINAYFSAFGFIKKHKLWGYVFVPGLINLLILAGVFLFAWEFSGWAVESLLAYFGYAASLEGSWWITLSTWLVTFVIRTLLVVSYFAIYKNLILIIMSPIMAFLTEKCLEKMGETVPDFDWISFLKNVLRGLRVALVNIVKEFILLILVGLLIWVPLIGFLSPILFFSISAYFYGYSMMDYVHEVRGLSLKEGNREVWQQKGLSLTLGAGFYGILLIPFIGLLIAPSFGVVATVISMKKLDK